jgi:hypothetical protein
MNIGDTFIWFPPEDRKEHLYIVITDPADNAGKFVGINLTKSGGGPHAVTFRVGEHPFIKRYPSDANIADALVMDEAEILAQISSGDVVPHQPMAFAMVQRIAIGAIGHPAISEEAEEMIKAEWS